MPKLILITDWTLFFLQYFSAQIFSALTQIFLSDNFSAKSIELNFSE
jgi:hypothetical protein